MKYQFPKRSHQCYVKQEAFQEEEEIISLLIPVGQTYERRDFCQKCWKETPIPGSVFWRVQIPRKEKEAPHSKDLEILDLFYATENKELLYLLALYLDRRGLFAKRKKNLFENITTGDLFQIEPIQVTSAHIDKLHSLINP